MHFMSKNPFMPKVLRKTIMYRLKLIKYLQQIQNWRQLANYKKQNFCVNLLPKTKAENLQNLNVEDLPENMKVLGNNKTVFQ